MSTKVRLDPRIVSSVYTGRPGCACGCRGRHTSDPRSIKMVVRTLNLLMEEGNDVDVSLTPFGDHDGYVAIQTENRLRIAYLRAPTKDALAE